MTSLTISLLGPPRIDVDSLPLRVVSRKAVALLAYLAVTGRPARRELLADLLWPVTSRPTGVRRYAARCRCFAPPWEPAGSRRRDIVGLDEHGVDLDLDLLAGCSSRARPRRSRSTAATSSGIRATRQRGVRSLANRRGSGAAPRARRRPRTGGARARTGRRSSRRSRARRRLELDPLAESGHRMLMQLYAWAGDRAAAIEQYRACVRTLHRELGVAPLAETTELYEQVSTGKIVQPAPRPPAAATPCTLSSRSRSSTGTPSRRTWSLPARHTDGRLVVIEGEAGIGKTRLADRRAARGRRRWSRDCRRARGRSGSGASVCGRARRDATAQRSAGRCAANRDRPSPDRSGGRTPRAQG